MIKGTAKIDFRVGPILYLRGEKVNVDNKYADMVEVKSPIMSSAQTVGEVILNKINEPKNVYATKKPKRVSK